MLHAHEENRGNLLTAREGNSYFYFLWHGMRYIYLAKHLKSSNFGIFYLATAIVNAFTVT